MPEESKDLDWTNLAKMFPALALPNVNKEEIELDLDDLAPLV